jgi:uncharacterized protein
MITELRVSNFYSIGESVTVSFEKGGKTNERGFFNSKNKKISLVNGFFGANASGKTNILRAMGTLIHMIYTSPNPNNVYNPNQNIFQIHQNYNESFGEESETKLGATFIFGDNIYKYDLKINNSGVITSESLIVKRVYAEKNATFVVVYQRVNNVITLGEAFKGAQNILDQITVTPNGTFIAFLQSVGYGVKVLEKVVGDFQSHEYLLVLGNIDHVPSAVTILGAGLSMKLNASFANDNALHLTQKALKIFDESIEEIEIDDNKNDTKIMVRHKNFTQKINMFNESRGTQELFLYIYSILNVLKNGGIVLYDELNRFFHPEIESEIVQLFLDESLNTKHAQLFLSSHNHELMYDLAPEQTLLVEKIDNSTQVTKISTFKELDKRVSIAKKYRSGVFGAIPDQNKIHYKLHRML